MSVTEHPLQVVSLRQRPDLTDQFWAVEGRWPEFMLHDPVDDACYERAAALFDDLHLVGLLDGRVVARVHAVPIDPAAVPEPPDRGFDWALESAVGQPRTDRTAVSLTEARIDPAQRGRGLSAALVRATGAYLRGRGTRDLLAPVRPNGKTAHPRVPMADYAARTRPDGLPVDDWLRVHVRLGARIVRVAPLSMTIPGTLEDWRSWTGQAFDRDGLVEVDGALAPVLVDTAAGHAVYVEANVWVHHRLGR